MDACLRYTNDILAWEYDQRNKQIDEHELEWYLKYAIKYKSRHILELACGSGRITIPFAEAGYSLDAIDISEAMINRLRVNLTQDICNSITLICEDMLAFEPTTS